MRYAAIKFRMTDESYIANITVVDDTTGSDVIRDRKVDLYFKDADYDATFQPYIFYWDLPYDTHTYSIYISNAGGVTGRTYGKTVPAGTVEYDYFLLTAPINPGSFDKTLYIWHNDFPSSLYSYLITSSPLPLLKTTTYNGDGTTKTFMFNNSTYRASEFKRVSVNGGLSWLVPGDPDFTFGSNIDLNNSLIDDNGFFGIKFFSAPTAGSSNVVIEWAPLANRARVEGILKQPWDPESTYIDFRTPVIIEDETIEFVGG